MIKESMEMENYRHIFNLPDLKFSQFCERKFSLNKGIYNTIDNWFYTKGITNILDRRELMVQFMIFCCSSETKVKFGPGCLTKKLEIFWDYQTDTLQVH